MAPLLELVDELRADIVLLAELESDSELVRSSLSKLGLGSYLSDPTQSGKISAFYRFPITLGKISQDFHRFMIREIKTDRSVNFLIACAHFPSKQHFDEADNAAIALQLAQCLTEAESAAGHKRSLLIGDFNANPYEQGIVGADKLHGLMTRELVATKNSRKVQSQEYVTTYNPMWKILGREGAPSGTYFHDSEAFHGTFWHCLDQVLIRPSLLDHIADNEIQVITHTSTFKFFDSKNGINNKISDHLPLHVKLRK